MSSKKFNELTALFFSLGVIDPIAIYAFVQGSQVEPFGQTFYGERGDSYRTLFLRT